MVRSLVEFKPASYTKYEEVIIGEDKAFKLILDPASTKNNHFDFSCYVDPILSKNAERVIIEMELSTTSVAPVSSLIYDYNGTGE